MEAKHSGAPAADIGRDQTAFYSPDVSPSPWRWFMIGLVFWATVINYLDRQTLSVVAPVLREEFGMSNVTYSRVVFGFLLAYTIMNGVSGPLIDRLGTRLGYALCMLWWSGSAILHAFATGPWTLGLARFSLGMGEAGNWPAGVKVVAEWFPKKERALASGIFNSGSAIGAILAPPLVAWILLQFGWPAAFVAVGVTGFLWLLVWWPSYHVPGPVAGSKPEETIPTRQLLKKKFVWVFTLSKIFMDPVWYFYIFWFPEYLKSARNFDMASIGKYGWIPFLVAGFGNILGGLLSSALLRRGWPLTAARKSSVTVFAALMTAAIPAVLVADVRVSIALVSLAMIGYTGSLANMMAFPADVFPKTVVGSVYGIASMGAGFGGMLFTLLTGWMVDHYSYHPVFFMFGIAPLVCTTILWLWLGPIEKGAADS
ncbi:MAG: MFS transporter [Acidobacteria bacterium]|nr:MAG: MFS transporter [Acidobacteriota bacterium]